MANLSNEHYWARLHLCKYLLNTCKYWIVYDELSNEFVVAHSDSDWTYDPESCKSIIDYFTLIAHVIFQMSCQQKTVVLSSTETKYMIVAVNLSGQEIFSMRLLLFQLLISMVIILVYFSRDPTLYKRSAPNILIFATTI